MATIVWDQVGEKTYQTGVDKGVLYLEDGTSAPWNGLISVEESPNVEVKSFYLDGVKYLASLIPGDFLGTLKAYTYPEEFDVVNGIVTLSPGLNLHDQPPKSFSLSYRTKIGNDIDGLDHGYMIHILYNVFAEPDSKAFNTLSGSDVKPVDFSWKLSGTPQKHVGYRPSMHISINSITTPPEVLETLENTLYGTVSTVPSLPTISEIVDIFTP